MAHVVRCAVVGYGASFNFGKAHATWISNAEGLELAAIVSRSAERTAAARRDWPGVAVYDDYHEVLARPDIDLITLVTPAHTHAPLAIRALRAGKHVVVEKPMCMTAEQATLMIEEAHLAARTLAVFHNRRHDGNYRTIKRLVDSGVIGHVFHVELSQVGYAFPWGNLPSYVDKSLAGNALYGWGAHGVDWVLNLIPSRIKQVTGFFHKLVWDEVSIEDQARALILFENGAVADILWSNISALDKPLWRILGTEGAIEDSGRDALAGYSPGPGTPANLAGAVPELVGHSSGHFTLVIRQQGECVRREVPYDPSDWVQYYRDLAAHLLHGAPIPVTAEAGRRTIDVMETAERSSLLGQSLPVRYP
jgi:scyllo-inositol 2-dehydrogenase (NADP+)